MPHAPETFVHLHNHTEFSLLDGASRIHALVEAAAKLEMPALAITDLENRALGTLQRVTTDAQADLYRSLMDFAAGLSPEAARFAVTDTIDKIGGARPRTFEAFVREQQSEWVTQPSPA